MRVAVTGATGFLGGRLVHRLLADGHQVIAFGRDRGKGAVLGTTFVPLDLTAPMPESRLGTADTVIHAAALASIWGPRAAFVAANVEGTRTALQLARRMGARRFVQISSSSVYFRFADQLGVREDMALPQPVNAYAETKRLADEAVRDVADLETVILRPRGIYGRGDVVLLPRLVRAAKRGPLPLLRGGAALSDLTHVDDVVDATVAALTASVPQGTILNISGGEPLPIRMIVESACRVAGAPVRWRPLPASLALTGIRGLEALNWLLPGRPEPVATAYSLGLLTYSLTLDLQRARDLLGWRPKITFAEGLSRL